MSTNSIVGLVALFVSLNVSAAVNPIHPIYFDLCVQFDPDEVEFEQILREKIGLADECVTRGDLDAIHSLAVSDDRAGRIKTSSLAKLSDFTRVYIGEKGTEFYIEGVILHNKFQAGTFYQNRFIHGFYSRDTFYPGIAAFTDDGLRSSYIPGLFFKEIGFVPGIAVSRIFANNAPGGAEGFTPGMFLTKEDTNGRSSVFAPGWYVPGAGLDFSEFNVRQDTEPRPGTFHLPRCDTVAGSYQQNCQTGLASGTPGSFTYGPADTSVFPSEVGFRQEMFETGFEDLAGLPIGNNAWWNSIVGNPDSLFGWVDALGVLGGGIGAAAAIICGIASGASAVAIGATMLVWGTYGLVIGAAAGIIGGVGYAICTGVSSLWGWLTGGSSKKEEDGATTVTEEAPASSGGNEEGEVVDEDEPTADEVIDPCCLNPGVCGANLSGVFASIHMAVANHPWLMFPVTNFDFVD